MNGAPRKAVRQPAEFQLTPHLGQLLFDKPTQRRVTVKAINHLADEAMKVFSL
jgi:hypothetical protein